MSLRAKPPLFLLSYQFPQSLLLTLPTKDSLNTTSAQVEKISPAQIKVFSHKEILVTQCAAENAHVIRLHIEH